MRIASTMDAYVGTRGRKAQLKWGLQAAVIGLVIGRVLHRRRSKVPTVSAEFKGARPQAVGHIPGVHIDPTVIPKIK